MKKLSIITILFVASLIVISCKKNHDSVAPEIPVASTHPIFQVYNATIGATRNYVYLNGAAVTGAAIAYGSLFPASSYGFEGHEGWNSILIKDTLAATTQLPINVASTFETNKNYTLFTYDTITKAKVAVVPTTIVIPTDTTARVRFANFAHAHIAVPAVDIFSKKRNQLVFTNVAFSQVTDFIPYTSALNDTLTVMQTGTGTVLATLNGFNPTIRRSYTLVFRGRYLDGTTAATARALSSFANF